MYINILHIGTNITSITITSNYEYKAIAIYSNKILSVCFL